MPAPPPVEFVVDRPFAFVLRDLKTGAVLFTGVVSRL
jgi:serine protease inhibitor